MILYWALVGAIVWAFYDEYVTEQKWPSICLCIAFLSLGCALHGVFVKWLYEDELKRLKNEYTKEYKILANVVNIVSAIFLCFFALSFLLGIVGMISPMILLFISGVIMIIRKFWEFCLLLICLFMICVVLNAFKLPMIKSILKLLYRMFLISFIVLIVYIEIDTWKNLTDTDSFITDCLIAGCTLLMFLFVFLCYLLDKSVSRGIFSFAKFRYVLFLRAFKDDDSIHSVYNKISKSITSVSFMKIGDPNKSERENTNEHWLPLSNWHFFLKFYISKANAIVTVVSSTDGLIWEMTQNMKYLNKCIIVFSSTNELIEFKKKLSILDDGICDIIINSIEAVIKNCWHYENAFVIRNKKIYLGEVCQLINCVLKNDFKNIKVINSAYISSTKTSFNNNYSISSISDFLFRHFHVLNFVNSIETINNQMLKGFLYGFGFVIVAVFNIIQFLLGVGMVLYPLVIWFGNDIEWLGISHESDSTVIKVLMTWFYVAFGLGFIKNLFRKD